MEPCYKTFISIGNGKQSFSRLLNVVEELSDLLPQPALVQCGHTEFHSQKLNILEFVSMDDFIRHMTNAEVLILHAGAGSVMNAIKAGKRPIVMPRTAKHDEVVNDHQISLAKMLQAEGKVIMVENIDELKLAIIKVLAEGIQLPSTGNNSKAISVIKKKLSQFLEQRV